MIFTQWPFAVFALIFFPLYFLTRGIQRTTITLLASYIFYSWWDWRFLSLLILTTLVDYVAALRIDDVKNKKERTRWIVVSMGANLIVLGFFKYFNFFIESMAALLTWAGINYSLPILNIVLPIGISFYTFQSMSYTIDVYRNKARARAEFDRICNMRSDISSLSRWPDHSCVTLNPSSTYASRLGLAACPPRIGMGDVGVLPQSLPCR
jgi:D-alanyl-lipoteichoic acid acyltransferase DltB (MBOAT superfamily)